MRTVMNTLSKIKILEKLPYGAELHEALQEFHQELPTSFVKGRNIVAGAARAWGLQFGALGEALEQDFLYQESFKLARNITLLQEPLLKNIFLILKYGITDKASDIMEFGSYRCGNAIFMAKVAQELGYTGKIYAFDTFEGIPHANAGIDFHVKNDFNDVVFEELTQKIQNLGLTNLVLVKGLFEETLPPLIPTIKKAMLVHIDCDVEAAARYVILTMEKQMADRGYMIIDDVTMPTCLGVLQAVEELLQKRGFHAEQVLPHFVYRMSKTI